ncbi:MAG: hypothetical protein WCP93_04410, partial [Candidatus Berkelbacteria bacterium]
EQTLKEIRVMSEGLNYVMEKVKKIDKIEEDVAVLKEDMKIVKFSLTQKADIGRVDNHEIRITELEKVKY